MSCLFSFKLIIMENYIEFKDLVNLTSFYLNDRKSSEIYVKDFSGWSRCSSNFSFKEVSLGLLYNYYEKAIISLEIDTYKALIVRIKQVCLITVNGEFFVFNSWDLFKEYIITTHKV